MLSPIIPFTPFGLIITKLVKKRNFIIDTQQNVVIIESVGEPHARKGGEILSSLNMKQWRLVKGLTVEQMAKACGVSANTYSAWEANPGKVKIDNAVKVARALGESIEDIFFERETTKC